MIFPLQTGDVPQDGDQQQLGGGPGHAVLLPAGWAADTAPDIFLYFLISDDQLLQKLADIYKFDFLLFDYSFEDFKEQLRNGVSNNNAR